MDVFFKNINRYIIGNFSLNFITVDGCEDGMVIKQIRASRIYKLILMERELNNKSKEL